jgi:IMP cyclohydrolase
MKNPNGPYPGRQVFAGVTAEGKPAFAYLVTGRSPASRDRKATPRGDSIIMGPLGDVPYDWLRHYTAVKYDSDTGLLVATNGIQTEAIFETYKLLYHTASAPDISYLKKIMAGASYEPDSLHTPRPAAVIANPTGKTDPVYLMSIATDDGAFAWRIKPKPGVFYGISTYCGDMENPATYDVEEGPAEIKCAATTPQAIADFIYDISAATYKGEDIRVCTIGGTRDGNTWKVALVNRHEG